MIVTKLIEDRTETSEVEAEARRLRVSCLNNLAACHFQWGHHTAVIQLSSAVLDINSGMVKALYRLENAFLEDSYLLLQVKSKLYKDTHILILMIDFPKTRAKR